MARLLFFKGEKTDKKIDDLTEVIEAVSSELPRLQEFGIEDILDYFDGLSRFWLAGADLLAQIPYLRALADFVSKKNFSEILTVALRGNYQVLDSFEVLPLGSSSVYYRCQPRGLVVHWLSGNAPLLGLYSLFLAMATKNVSIVKPSSRAHKDFVDILATLREVNTDRVRGADFLKGVAAALIDREDKNLQNELSRRASVRIAWGGKEAIEAISGLAKSIHCEDVLLGPKYSLGIVDKESLSDHKKIAGRIALDIATFDQYACSSPHTIFVEKGGAITPEEFAQELANSLDFVGKKFIKKIAPDPAKNMDILAIRAKYSMLGKVFASADTEWTVVVSKESGLGPACASRVIFVRPVDSLQDIKPFIDRGKQTMGTALSSPYAKELLNDLTASGVDRCPPFGRMTFFESPWDGMFIVDRLVRWVSYYEK